MSYDREGQQALNRHHRLYPAPGDYWEDLFCPVALVLDVTLRTVTFVQRTREVATDLAGDRWTWDLAQPERADRAVFAARFRYGGAGPLADQTWADVHPGLMADVANAWRHREGLRRVWPEPAMAHLAARFMKTV